MAKCEICGKEKPDDRVLSVTNFKQCGNPLTTICTECYHEYAHKFKGDTCAADYFGLTRIFLKDHGIHLQNKGVMRCELCDLGGSVRIVQFPDNPDIAPMFMCHSCAERWRNIRDRLPKGVPVPDNVIMDTLAKMRRK